MPARLSKIKSAANDYGIEVSTPRRGSHWKAKKGGYRTYPLPAHHGSRTMISDHYINGFCRNFGIDPEEFKGKL